MRVESDGATLELFDEGPLDHLPGGGHAPFYMDLAGNLGDVPSDALVRADWGHRF
jgi:hypothetical protein